MKRRILFSVLIISAMLVSTKANAAYYELQEVQGAEGSQIIVITAKQQPKYEQNDITASKDVQKETPKIQSETLKTQTKQEVIAKYNLNSRETMPSHQTQRVQKNTEEYVSPNRQNPVIEQKVQTVAFNTSPAKKQVMKEDDVTKVEKPAQEKFEAKVEKNHNYYAHFLQDDPLRIVTKIGNDLKSANGLDLMLNFNVVEEEEVNACTDINNNIYVYSGILPYIENEDELAFIIGHEMGHAASHHVVKSVVTNAAAKDVNKIGKKQMQSKVTGVAASKIGNMLGKAGFENLGSLASGAISQAGDKAVDATTTAATSTLQRGRENDADLLAIDYMVKKGYNPLAGISIMAKIGEVYPDFFVDHPSTDKRVVTMYEYIKKNYPQYIAQGFNTESYSTAVAQYVKKK